MKLSKTVALLGLLAWSVMNCKKADIDPPLDPTATCKLMKTDWGSGNYQSFDYDGTGLITRMTAKYASDVYVYTFTYNANKQITGATITRNGKKPTDLSDIGIGDAVKLTWKDGHVIQTLDQLDGKSLLTTTVSYDSEGRIVSFKGDADRAWGKSFEKVFTYETNGNFRYTYWENGVRDYYEDNQVNTAVKHPESLLASRGLPFDISFSTPWRANDYRTLNGYSVDLTGHTTLVRTIQYSHTVINSYQMVTAQQAVEDGKSAWLPIPCLIVIKQVDRDNKCDYLSYITSPKQRVIPRFGGGSVRPIL